jgi:hypothetical protein
MQRLEGFDRRLVVILVGSLPHPEERQCLEFPNMHFAGEVGWDLDASNIGRK